MELRSVKKDDNFDKTMKFNYDEFQRRCQTVLQNVYHFRRKRI